MLNHHHNAGFIEDDYKESQILLDIGLEDCSGSNINKIWEVKHIQSTTNHSQFVLLLDNEGLLLFDKNQESSVQLVQSDDIPISSNTFQALEKICEQEINNKAAVDSDSKKVLYGHGLGICKKALNLAIMNGTNKALEDVLQQFISEQISHIITLLPDNLNKVRDVLHIRDTCPQLRTIAINVFVPAFKMKYQNWGQKGKISGNVLCVSHGIMIPETAPQKSSCGTKSKK
ncbi:1911_t:CDS:2, partial [Ambispora leptoticha]